MKTTAKILSLVFHPLFLIGYVLILLLTLNPYIFSIQDEKSRFLLIFSVLMLTIFFPLFSIFMMKMLELIKSFEMKDKQERIGPLIVTGVFYLWLFVNIKGNSTIPAAFSFFVLGSTIGLFLALMINSFTKISLHTVGMGGLLAGFFIIRYFYAYDSFILRFPFGVFNIHTNVIMLLVIVVAGAVGTSRLLLKAHNTMDVYGGYIVGIFAQLIAFRIMG
ncbi:MAG: hypothetical protein V3V14_14270 [Saprospiraceae bacterium]